MNLNIKSAGAKENNEHTRSTKQTPERKKEPGKTETSRTRAQEGLSRDGSVKKKRGRIWGQDNGVKHALRSRDLSHLPDLFFPLPFPGAVPEI